MIELYLIVWTFISQSSGTYLNGGEQIEKYTVQISSSFVCPEKPCQVKVYPIKYNPHIRCSGEIVKNGK